MSKYHEAINRSLVEQASKARLALDYAGNRTDTAPDSLGQLIPLPILDDAPGKVARSKAVDSLRKEVEATILAKFPDATSFEISQAFDYLQKKAFRISILD